MQNGGSLVGDFQAKGENISMEMTGLILSLSTKTIFATIICVGLLDKRIIFKLHAPISELEYKPWA